MHIAACMGVDIPFIGRTEITVCIVGLSSVGCAIAEVLARTGVGKLILIDHETVRWF